MENNDNKQLTNVKKKLSDLTSKEISEYLNRFPPKYQFNDDEYELRLKLIKIYVSRFPAGYKFDPSDDVLICDYLIPNIRGERLPINLMHDVSLYSHNPEYLAARCSPQGPKGWYFFTPRDKKYPNGTRPARHAGDGYWKAIGADKYIYRNDIHVGLRKTLVFYKGRPPKGKKTPWIMHEFRTPDPPKVAGSSKVKPKKVNDKGKKRKFSSDDNDVDDLKDVCMRLGDSVLCRIYEKTTRASLTNKPSAEVEEKVSMEEDEEVPPPIDVDNDAKENNYIHPPSYNNGLNDNVDAYIPSIHPPSYNNGLNDNVDAYIPSTDINHNQVDMYHTSNIGRDNNQVSAYNANNNIGQNQADMYHNTSNNRGDNHQVSMYNANNNIDHNRVNMYHTSNIGRDNNQVSAYNANNNIGQNQADMYHNTSNDRGDNPQGSMYNANNNIDHNRVNMYSTSNYVDYNHLNMYNRSYNYGGENVSKYHTYIDAGYSNDIVGSASYNNYVPTQAISMMGGFSANQLGGNTGFSSGVNVDRPSTFHAAGLDQDTPLDTLEEPWSCIDEFDFADCLNYDFDDYIEDPMYSPYTATVPPNANVFGMTSFDVPMDMVSPQGDLTMDTVEVKDEQPPLPPPHLPPTPRPSV